MAAEMPGPVDPLAVKYLNPVQAAAVERAKAFMDRNLGVTIGVGEIAAAACVSRFHLARLFRAATELSPTAWLRQRRIDQARRWLREGAQPVGRIATELAFFDQSHFTRSFRAATGCSPRRYALQQLSAH